MTRNRIVLAAAVIAVAALLAVYMRPKPGPASPHVTHARAQTTATEHIQTLRADAPQTMALAGVHRNLFTFDDPPVVRVAAPRIINIVPRVEAAPQPVISVAQEPVPPPLPFRCIGRFGNSSTTFVALADDTHNVVNARAGEIVDGRFIVRAIGVESVDIGFVGFPASADKRIAIGH
jgi:hypothetical protein